MQKRTAPQGGRANHIGFDFFGFLSCIRNRDLGRYGIPMWMCWTFFVSQGSYPSEAVSTLIFSTIFVFMSFETETLFGSGFLMWMWLNMDFVKGSFPS